MDKPLHLHLSRRESQIMDVLYRLGESASRLSQDDLDEIAQWIEDARQGST